MCRVFDVSRSGYYDWRHRKPSARAQENERLKVAIRVAHSRSRESYAGALSYNLSWRQRALSRAGTAFADCDRGWD